MSQSTWKAEPTQRRSSRAFERSDIYEQGINDKGLPGPKNTIANYVENKYVPLIAAAPELLKALEALLDVAPFARDENERALHLRAEAVIRKAKGEPEPRP